MLQLQFDGFDRFDGSDGFDGFDGSPLGVLTVPLLSDCVGRHCPLCSPLGGTSVPPEIPWVRKNENVSQKTRSDFDFDGFDGFDVQGT